MALVEATVCHKLEAMYGSRAQLARKVSLNGSLPGQARRGREGLIFALTDHPEACCCYVWEEDGRVRTILGEDATSEAMRAAIEAHSGANGADVKRCA